MAATIEGLETQLVSAMQSFDTGAWVRRQEIAKKLGKPKLQPTDILMLQILVDRGVLESRQVESRSPAKTRFEYRVNLK